MTNFILVLLLSTVAFGYPSKPDDSITKPHYCTQADKDFSEFRYQEKIAVCKRKVTDATKAAVYNSYNVPQVERKEYTVDHLVPLSMGGSNNKLNLWPQHRSISTARLESELYKKLKGGEIKRSEAVDQLLKVKYGR